MILPISFIRPLLLICFLICSISPVIANECNKEDQVYADLWENYYSPKEAYNFGIKIQNLVLNRNLSGIFAVVQGELQNGPSKKYIVSKSFSELFDERWIEQVVSDSAPCSPIGWRGFMLGNGLIWYNKTEDGWRILSINGDLPLN